MTEEFVYPNIYLCGKSGAGKSTVANMLVNEFGYRKTALADGVKLGVDSIFTEFVLFKDYVREVFPNAKKKRKKAYNKYVECGKKWKNKFLLAYETYGELPKKSYRDFMQWWGTDVCRAIDKNVWIAYYLRHTYEFETPIVLDDIRFENEECEFFFRDYIGIHIIRDEYDNSTISEDQAKHESEQYEPQYCKYTIYNVGDLEQLNSRLHEIMEAVMNEYK